MPQDLPFLLALLDDETPIVRSAVIAELKALGPRLRQLTQPYWTELTEPQRQVLEAVFTELESLKYTNDRLAWLNQEDFYQALEQALIVLSEIEFGPVAQFSSDWLDLLAEHFLAQAGTPTSLTLMQYLLGGDRLTCISEYRQLYHHDLLFHIVQHGVGSQMALNCVALLVGKRVGIDLHGIFIQGHFMSIACQDTRLKMYNVHHGGKPHSRSSALYMEEALRRNCTWPSEMRAPVFEIIQQLLYQSVQPSKHPHPKQRAEFDAYYQELTDELRQRGLLFN